MGLRILKRELEKKRIVDNQRVLCKGTSYGCFCFRLLARVFRQNKRCLLRKFSNSSDVCESDSGSKVAGHLRILQLDIFKQKPTEIIGGVSRLCT